MSCCGQKRTQLIQSTQANQANRPGKQTSLPNQPDHEISVNFQISDVQLSAIEPLLNASEKRLKAEINFRLSGADTDFLISQDSSYWIDIYTINIDKGTRELVASKGSQFKPNLFKYTHQLEFAMPYIGRYELLSLVRLPPPSKVMGYRKGPTIRIIS